jgi:formylglycine-generating enzyme required for sulfatase activity
MSGNLAEWTATKHDEGPYTYIIKGGSADRPDYDTRCAARSKKHADSKDKLLGFRCCASPK